MSITLTERAAKHVKGSLEKRGKGIGIRLGVKTAGCSENLQVLVQRQCEIGNVLVWSNFFCSCVKFSDSGLAGVGSHPTIFSHLLRCGHANEPGSSS